MFSSSYRVYTVHINPSLPKPYEAAEFVEEGFNIKALIFSGFWALYHRLWWPMFAIIVGNMMIFQMADSGAISEVGRAVLQLAFNLFIGFEANDWRRAKLAGRGYITADIVTGDSMIRAEQRFYDRYFTETPAQ
jgi:Protein of unknown function (DUF2628)